MIDNQGVALAVLPQKGSQALAQGASAVTGVAAAALREARLCMHPPIAGSHPKSLVHIQRWLTVLLDSA